MVVSCGGNPGIDNKPEASIGNNDTASSSESKSLVVYFSWWGDAAWVVDDFVKLNDFTGKTVIPFCTSMSSGLGQSGTKLAAMAGTGNWLEGKRFGTSASQTVIEEWLDGLNLKK